MFEPLPPCCSKCEWGFDVLVQWVFAPVDKGSGTTTHQCRFNFQQQKNV